MTFPQRQSQTSPPGRAIQFPASFTRIRWLLAPLAAALLLWLALVAVVGVLLAAQLFGIQLAGPARDNFAEIRSIWLAVSISSVCLLSAILTRRLRPAATLPLTFALCGAILFPAAINTGSATSVLVVLAIVFLAWLLGDALLVRQPLPTANAVVRVPLAIAFGLVVEGLLLFLFVSLGQLTMPIVLGGAAIILLIPLISDRQRLRAELSRLYIWRPEAPSWFETVVLGLSLGFVTYALLTVFVPERHADAVQDHLPIAREIWQAGSAPYIPPITTSRDPIQAHLLYAVAYGFGGMTASKILHAAIGIVAIMSIAAVGWLISGRIAAVIGAALFATMPLSLWEIGHVYPDLFPVLYTSAGILCLLFWQRDAKWIWLINAGVLTGFGFSTKKTMGIVIIGLVVGIFLIGRGRAWRRWREHFLSVAIFALCGTAVVVPWLLRGYSLGGSALPDLRPLYDFTVGGLFPGNTLVAPAMTGVTASDSPRSESTSGLLELVRSPWLLALHQEPYRRHYAVIQGSDIGVTLLMLLPLVTLGPRTRAAALLVATMAVSYVIWWFLPTYYQNTRHLLPTLGIAASLAGIGVASATAGTMQQNSRLRRSLAMMTPFSVILGLLIVPFIFLPDVSTRVPINLLIGRETAAEYVAREIPAATVLAATSSLPADTPVGYAGNSPGAQIYTEVRLVPLTTPELNSARSKPEEVLATLERLGIDYIIWDRESTDPKEWRSTLLSTDFLRNYSRILSGDRDAYLFEILPNDGLTWGEAYLQDLLAVPGVDALEPEGRSGTPVPATTPESAVRQCRGDPQCRAERRAERRTQRQNKAAATPSGYVEQRVPAEAGAPYVLVAYGSCAQPDAPAELALRWLDERGAELDTAAEAVVPGTAGSEQFLWRRAPAGTVAVTVDLSAPNDGGCQFDTVSLYKLS